MLARHSPPCRLKRAIAISALVASLTLGLAALLAWTQFHSSCTYVCRAVPLLDTDSIRPDEVCTSFTAREWLLSSSSVTKSYADVGRQAAVFRQSWGPGPWLAMSKALATVATQVLRVLGAPRLLPPPPAV